MDSEFQQKVDSIRLRAEEIDECIERLQRLDSCTREGAVRLQDIKEWLEGLPEEAEEHLENLMLSTSRAQTAIDKGFLRAAEKHTKREKKSANALTLCMEMAADEFVQFRRLD